MTWVLLMGNVREKEKGLWEKGENERERERSKTEATAFYNLILEVTYHYPCSIGHTDKTSVQHERQTYKGVKTQSVRLLGTTDGGGLQRNNFYQVYSMI